MLPKSIVLASLQYNTNTNGYDVLTAFRMFGAAQNINSFSGGQSYYKDFGLLTANGVWDGSSDWSQLMATNNLVGTYKLKDPDLLF